MSNTPEPAPPSVPQPHAATSAPNAAAITPEVLKSAYNAFKKRFKVMQLDDASRIGRSPMSSGGKSSIAGIKPPDQFPREVWEELAKQGKIHSVGHGMYSLKK